MWIKQVHYSVAWIIFSLEPSSVLQRKEKGINRRMIMCAMICGENGMTVTQSEKEFNSMSLEATPESIMVHPGS